MNADSYFTIGRSHMVCEDYARHLNTDKTAVYISDGCSSSPHSDFGSRLMVLAAAQFDSHPYDSPTLVKLAQSMKPFCLPDTALDATLLSAMADTFNSCVNVTMLGDGFAVARHRSTQKLEMWKVHCPQGAPDFPSYLLNPLRKAGYLEKFNLPKECWHAKDYPTHRGIDFELVGPESSFEPVRLSYPASIYDLVVIASDGVSSFQRPEGNVLVKVPEWDVLAEIIGGLKNYQGQFIARRLRNGFSKFCQEQGWQHYDDLSVGAIFMEKVTDEPR